jgi:hypothetical protein
MTHTLTVLSFHHRWRAQHNSASCISWDLTAQWRWQPSGVWRRVVWQRGTSVQETLSATIRVRDEGSRLLHNDTSLPDHTMSPTQDNHLHEYSFPTPIPVGSQKRMCKAHKCSLVLRHHLEWHPVTAACKNTVHYFQLLMAVVVKMVTWIKLSHSEDGDSVSLKWQLCCIKTRRLQSSEQPALFVNKIIPVLNEASSHECTRGAAGQGSTYS